MTSLHFFLKAESRLTMILLMAAFPKGKLWKLMLGVKPISLKKSESFWKNSKGHVK